MRPEPDKAGDADAASMELQCESSSAGPGAAVWGWWSARVLEWPKGKGLKADWGLTGQEVCVWTFTVHFTSFAWTFPLVLLFCGSQCPMQEMKPQTNVLDLLPKLQSMALADRAVFEKGMKAFVSYVQAYAKHECNLIFRIKGNSQQGWYLLLFFSDNKSIVVLSTSFSFWFLISHSLPAPSDFDKPLIFQATCFNRKHLNMELDQTDKSRSDLFFLLVLRYRVKTIH